MILQVLGCSGSSFSHPIYQYGYNFKRPIDANQIHEFPSRDLQVGKSLGLGFLLIWVSFWEGLRSGAMLVLGRVLLLMEEILHHLWRMKPD